MGLGRQKLAQDVVEDPAVLEICGLDGGVYPHDCSDVSGFSILLDPHSDLFWDAGGAG